MMTKLSIVKLFNFLACGSNDVYERTKQGEGKKQFFIFQETLKIDNAGFN